MKYLYRITVRPLRIVPSEREPWGFIVAVNKNSEQHAVTYARDCYYTPDWWKENLLCDVEFIGELKFIEDISLPPVYR